ELRQLNADLFEAGPTDISASELPARPGLNLSVSESSLEVKQVTKMNIFGRPYIDRVTGEPITETQRYVKGTNLLVYAEREPVLYWPYLQGDINAPLGPLQNFNFGYNQIFGAQFFTTLNAYDLLGLTRVPGTRWRFDVDYMTARGPALGTQFDFEGKDLFGIRNRYQGLFKLYGIYDNAEFDTLGGGRGITIRTSDTSLVPVFKRNERGRAFFNLNMQDVGEDGNGFIQVYGSALSDKNFLEQFYAPEFQTGLNQE